MFCFRCLCCTIRWYCAFDTRTTILKWLRLDSDYKLPMSGDELNLRGTETWISLDNADESRDDRSRLFNESNADGQKARGLDILKSSMRHMGLWPRSGNHCERGSDSMNLEIS
eukprot:TRINITY_DN49418_c0_g1_i1.p2 TRINITY_DN49418_c0_g1~~TRINITY_DN49418_c0_g1_i1.p2  ORF type:complete len:113 (+),score=2.02 TRINITY_DN49418_c0_g1_i1:347-685(+)